MDVIRRLLYISSGYLNIDIEAILAEAFEYKSMYDNAC